MNLLAHLHVADHLPPIAAAGNLTADFCKEEGSTEFQVGVQLHRQIDSFTDSHPDFAQARAMFPGSFRRFGGILADLAFDLCLSRSWEEWEPDLTRADFIESRLRDIHEFRNQLPRPASFVLSRMTKLRWLHCYSEIDGIGATIRRIAARRPALARMVGAEQWMEQRFDDFLGIFRRFYPELRAHVSADLNHHEHDPACAPEAS